MSGAVTLTIPKGSNTGDVLRLKGKGVPALRGGSTGDLYLVVMVKLPEQLDDAAKKALASLDTLYAGDVRAKLAL